MGDSDEEAPPEVHHYNHIHEVPWDIQKCDSFPLLQVIANKLTSTQLLATTTQDLLQI